MEALTRRLCCRASPAPRQSSTPPDPSAFETASDPEKDCSPKKTANPAICRNRATTLFGHDMCVRDLADTGTQATVGPE